MLMGSAPDIAEAAISKNVFDRAVADTKQELMYSGRYPMIVDIDISLREHPTDVVMALVVKSATDRVTALNLGEELIRCFSRNAVKNGSGTTMPTKDNYGSLFDEYGIYLAIAPKHATTDPSQWYYNYVISPRAHMAQGPGNPRWR